MATELGFRASDDDSLVTASESNPFPVAQQGPTEAREYVSAAFEAITVAATAIGVTQVLLDTIKPRRAFFTNATAQIRYRYDPNALATATVGHPVEIGDSFVLEGYLNIARFNAIRTGGTSGVLSVTLEI